MSLPEPVRKTPLVPRKPWPPADYVNKKLVTLADSWGTLAGGRDPWRLILYNFRTRNPHEVNWYLYNWVGCRAVTPDGKNYRFGSFDDRAGKAPGASTPLYIYIPHPGWEPDYDDIARDLVYETLIGASARAVYFNTSVANLHYGDIGSIGMMVGGDHIQVSFNPSLVSHNAGAQYIQKADLIQLGSLRTDLGARSRIVHEAVHAAFDARRASLTAVEEEAIAYIAQCYYLQLLNGPTLPSSSFDWKPLAQKAWPIATAKRTGTPASPADFDALKTAVMAAYPHLAAAPHGHYTHNGIS